MPKGDALHIRVTDEMKAALEEAAHDEERSVSAFVERVLAGWLREKGYMEKAKAKLGKIAKAKPAPQQKTKAQR